jgi:hypothetical protein
MKNEVSYNLTDTSELQTLLSFTTVESAALLINKDTLTFFSPQVFKNHKAFALSQFYYNTEKQQFQFDNLNLKINSLPFTNKSLIQNGIVFFDSITNFVIYNLHNSNALLKNKALIELTREPSIAAKFGSQLFILRIESPKELVILDSNYNKKQKFILEQSYYSVASIFVYDLNRDGNPEVIIFYKGDIARPNTISYSIYSLSDNNL